MYGSSGTGANLTAATIPDQFFPGTPGNLVTDYPEGYVYGPAAAYVPDGSDIPLSATTRLFGDRAETSLLTAL